MKINKSLLIFSIALVISSVIVSGSLIYFSQNNAPAVLGGDEHTSITDEQGNVYSIEKEDPTKLTIISDTSCWSCSTEKVEAWLKGQVGTQLAIRRLEYDSPAAEDLINTNGITFLPYLLTDNGIEQRSNFKHLAHHIFSKSDTGYYVDLIKIGQPIGRYLDSAYYAKNDPEAPKIVSKSSTYDFGDVRLSGGKVSTEFIVKNEGKNPLDFLNASPSCNCTSAQIVVGGETSPVYLMAGHGEPVNWRGSLAPGEEGKIIVYYDPSIHPDLNEVVTREVTINTNDPNTPRIKFKINVNQIKD